MAPGKTTGLTIGVTGGIGSGKSALTSRFEALGITVVDADLAARVIVEPGRDALDKIRQHFGEQILSAHGTLDRAALRQRVFADETERRWLEIRKALPGLHLQTTDRVVVEACWNPLRFLSGHLFHLLMLTLQVALIFEYSSLFEPISHLYEL